MNTLDTLILAIEDMYDSVPQGHSIYIKKKDLDQLNINWHRVGDIIEHLAWDENFLEWDYDEDDGNSNWPENTLVVRITDSESLRKRADEIRQRHNMGRYLKKKEKPANIISYGDLELDFDHVEVRYGNTRPATEVNFEREAMIILRMLVEAQGKVVSYSEIYEELKKPAMDKSDLIKQQKYQIKTYLIDRGMEKDIANKLYKLIKPATLSGYRLST